MSDVRPVKPFTTAESRWQAVQERDSTADGAFVYAVKTTGIYCRPVCASRQPRRENVSFYEDAQAAERAGFRACRRCRPAAASQTDQHAALVERACRQIEATEQSLPLSGLATTAGLSESQFQRLFKAGTGVTPREYAAACRAKRVRTELVRDQTITAAMTQAGFPSSGRFYEQSAALLGMTPGRFRAGGDGAVIRFAVGECSLGSILVAASQIGICAIFLGDDPEILIHEVQDRFPRAELVGGDAEFEQLVARVVGLVESPGSGFNLPLDIRGTAFQQRVWQALREIPPGTTLSYSELAEKIGSPQSVRAVGGACAANPLAVAIPCHRVVRTDGGLSGYRWGIERKSELLRREGADKQT